MFLGASEMLMANAVSELGAKTPGKEAVAIESFAKALRQVCTWVVESKVLLPGFARIPENL